MKILYNNEVINSTITALTENPDYDFTTALNDTNLSRVGRTVDIDDQWLKFTFTSEVSGSYCCIMGHNLTSSATVTIEANSTDVWTSPSLSEALEITGDSLIVNFTSASYQYWRLTIDDPTNPDGYLQIGYIFLGEALTMPGMDTGQAIPISTQSTTQKSTGGQLYGDRRIHLKAAEITFNNIVQSYKILIDSFFEYVDIVTPFIMLVWEDDLDVEEPLYCALTNSLNWKRMTGNGLFWNLTFSIEECK